MHCSIFPGNATLLTSNRKMHYAEEQLLSTFKSLVSEWMAWFLFSPPQSCPKDTSPSHQQNVRQLCLVSRFISSSQKKINNFRLSSLCYYNSLLKRYITKKILLLYKRGFPSGSVVKNLSANAGDMGSTPGSGRSPGEGTDNPLQYSCLETPMNRGAWRAIVHRVTKSWTRLKRLHST